MPIINDMKGRASNARCDEFRIDQGDDWIVVPMYDERGLWQASQPQQAAPSTQCKKLIDVAAPIGRSHVVAVLLEQLRVASVRATIYFGTDFLKEGGVPVPAGA